MLTVYRDSEGHIEFAAECQVVDRQGKLNPDGDCVWVERLEANPQVDLRGYVKRLIADMAALHPKVKWAYWTRFWEQIQDRQLRYGSRRQLTRWALRTKGVCV